MAKRGGRRTKPGRKSEAEARIERITWALMVGVFGLIYIVPEGQIPNAAVPFAGAVILLGAGLYQYSQRWRVSPMTWIAGTVMLLLATYNLTFDETANFYGFTLLVFAVVIGVGVLTGET
ncbi:MAG: hypothetical protein ACOCXR_01930 [Phototrophicaceae bacterium]